jgi:hypothetical protein
MEILLALAATVSYGVSDFAGGVLTRRVHVFVVHVFVVFPQLNVRPWSGEKPIKRIGPPRFVAGKPTSP